MRKVLVIALREYQASVRTKSFIISLVIMPVLMGGSILVQTLVKDMGDTQTKRFAVVDRTAGEQFFQLLEASPAKKTRPLYAVKRLRSGAGDAKGAGKLGREYEVRFHPPTQKRESTFTLERVKPKGSIDEQRYELSERVRQGDLFGFVEIGPDVYQPWKPGSPPPDDRGKIRYQTNTPTYDTFTAWLMLLVDTQVKVIRCVAKGVNPEDLPFILQTVPLVSRGLTDRTAEGVIVEAKEQNRMAAFFAPFGLVMLMFMVLMVGATPLIQGIVEEKMQRIAEVLLGSVRPFDLMLGKLLGMVGVSLTLVAVYLGGAYWAAHHFGYTEYLPLDLLAWFLVFQTLAVLMFGSLFIAIGAACTDTKESQTMLMPVMLLACVPLFVLGNIIREPNSSFALGLSFFPFATPMLMTARLAVPPGIPWWEPLLGVVVVLATTLLCVYAAGRIFRVGILMQGKGAKFTDLFRWVFRG